MFGVMVLSFFLGVAAERSEDWRMIVGLSFLTCLLAATVVSKAYDFKHPRQTPTQESAVIWGAVDNSTLNVGSNSWDIEVGLHPDGRIEYRKGKAR